MLRERDRERDREARRDERRERESERERDRERCRFLTELLTEVSDEMVVVVASKAFSAMLVVKSRSLCSLSDCFWSHQAPPAC